MARFAIVADHPRCCTSLVIVNENRNRTNGRGFTVSETFIARNPRNFFLSASWFICRANSTRFYLLSRRLWVGIRHATSRLCTVCFRRSTMGIDSPPKDYLQKCVTAICFFKFKNCLGWLTTSNSRRDSTASRSGTRRLCNRQGRFSSARFRHRALDAAVSKWHHDVVAPYTIFIFHICLIISRMFFFLYSWHENNELFNIIFAAMPQKTTFYVWEFLYILREI